MSIFDSLKEMGLEKAKELLSENKDALIDKAKSTFGDQIGGMIGNVANQVLPAGSHQTAAADSGEAQDVVEAAQNDETDSNDADSNDVAAGDDAQSGDNADEVAQNDDAPSGDNANQTDDSTNTAEADNADNQDDNQNA